MSAEILERDATDVEALALIDAGIALLDEHRPPSWVFSVNLDTLDMSEACDCVLGQAFHQEASEDDRGVNPFEYGAGLLQLNYRYDDGLPSPTQYGFDDGWHQIPGGDRIYLMYGHLQELWAVRLTELRAARSAPPVT